MQRVSLLFWKVERTMMEEMKISEFLEAVSSSVPVPGGGGVSACVAALGMCLGSMVANLTAGKKKYAAYEEEIQQLLQKAGEVTKRLVSGMDKDAEAFEPLSKAYGLPKGTEEEIAKRTEIMEKALAEASTAPLELMEEILAALEILSRLSVIGSRIAISDAGVGAQLCRAALNGASLNVYINTKLMKNRQTAESMNQRAQELTVRGNALADEIYSRVENSLH